MPTNVFLDVIAAVSSRAPSHENQSGFWVGKYRSHAVVYRIPSFCGYTMRRGCVYRHIVHTGWPWHCLRIAYVNKLRNRLKTRQGSHR